MSVLTNNFLLAGVVATLLIVVYYCYVNYLMKTPTNDDNEDSNRSVPLSVTVVDYGKKFMMFYVLSLGLVFVGKKYLVSSDSMFSTSSVKGGGSTTSNLTGMDGDSEGESCSGGFFSNLFKGGKKEVSNEELSKLSEVNIKRKNTNMETFKTGQPSF